jgi:hypothetical protein
MDSPDNQSVVLHSELGDSQNHLPGGNDHHAFGNDLKRRSADVSEIAQHQGGTYPLTASPGPSCDHRISADGLTGDADNKYDV